MESLTKNEHLSTLLDIVRLFLFWLVVDLKHHLPGLQVEKELSMLCAYDEGRLVGSLGNEEVETERYYKR